LCGTSSSPGAVAGEKPHFIQAYHLAEMNLPPPTTVAGKTCWMAQAVHQATQSSVFAQGSPKAAFNFANTWGSHGWSFTGHASWHVAQSDSPALCMRKHRLMQVATVPIQQ